MIRFALILVQKASDLAMSLALEGKSSRNRLAVGKVNPD